MAIRFAERMDNLGTEGAFVVLAKARNLEAQGKEIIHFEIGEPDFATPDNIVESAVGALQAGYTHYTPAGGIMQVREATANFVSKRLGLDVDPLEVIMVPGSKNIVLFTLLACVEPGEEVIVPDPGYPAYESLVRFTGAVPKFVHLREETGFRLDLDELQSLIGPKTRLVIINTPQNPTGGILTREDVEFICAMTQEHDLLLLSDEIYSQIIYGDFEHVSPLSQAGMRERTILLDGMSKAYAMCGWRLGYGVAPRALIERMETLMINSSSCAAAFSQMAAIEAFEGPESDRAVHAMVEEFERRRDAMVDRLNAIPGFRCNKPDGSFYAFPNITATGVVETELAERLLNEAGVAVLPGTAFGEGGRGYLRLAYTQSLPDVEKGLQRIADFIAAL